MEFENGKIYTIRSSQTDKYYIGSTNQKTLAQRLGKHRSTYKDYLKGVQHYVTSFEILQYTDHYIELLELCPCNIKAELHKREGELIRLHKDSLVNRCIPCRTVKEYLIDNKEILAVKAKQRGDIYRVDNKQKIRDYKTQPYHCECGRVIQLDKKARHCTTNIHIDSIKQNKKITISQEDYDLLVYCDSLMLSSNSYTNFIISQ